MLGSSDEIQLLQNLVRAIGGRKTLDIGVYTGYSAMSIALALPEDGKVVACDTNEEYANIGKPFWREAGVYNKVDLRIAPAAETLEKLIVAGDSDTFDFAFIDADKPSYDLYYEKCLQLVRSGGIIAIDNMLWGGEVCNEESTDFEVPYLRALAEKLKADTRVHVSFLTLGDGTVLAFKK